MMHLVSPPTRVEQTDVCENITFARFTMQGVIMFSRAGHGCVYATTTKPDLAAATRADFMASSD